MKRLTRWIALCCVGASLAQFGNCVQNLTINARDGALSAWESWVTSSVREWLDSANPLPLEE